jgi:hypothetical protein
MVGNGEFTLVRFEFTLVKKDPEKNYKFKNEKSDLLL